MLPPRLSPSSPPTSRDIAGCTTQSVPRYATSLSIKSRFVSLRSARRKVGRNRPCTRPPVGCWRSFPSTNRWRVTSTSISSRSGLRRCPSDLLPTRLSPLQRAGRRFIASLSNRSTCCGPTSTASPITRWPESPPDGSRLVWEKTWWWTDASSPTWNVSGITFSPTP